MAQVLGNDRSGTLQKNSTTQVQLNLSTVGDILASVDGQQYQATNALLLNTGGTGAGGLDAGALSTNQLWYVHFVLSGSSLALLASLSKTAPTGFTSFLWTGWAFTTNSSSQVNVVTNNVSTSFLAPTQQRFTSGSGTYTTPIGAIYLRVRMVGGGGGGSNSGTAGTFSAGSSGSGSTTFTSNGDSGASATLTAGQGGGGQNGAGGAGGTATISGSSAVEIVRLSGGIGGGAKSGGTAGISGIQSPGAMGAPSFFGGAGAGNRNASGSAAKANSGSGGGGGGSDESGAAQIVGAGGGAGGYLEAMINLPVITYAYSIATGGAGGTGGNAAGGAGGSGYIEVTEYYQ